VYTAAGFVVEGVLREEFHLDGGYVDDVLMARNLTPDGGPA
jgi:RimJ/RimL family protein N-acetyltransferase